MTELRIRLWRVSLPALLIAAATFLAAQQAPKPPAEQSPAAPAAGQTSTSPAGRPADGPGGGGMMMMGRGNAGQISAISGDSFTLKTQMGATLTVKTTAETRFFSKDRTPAALKDLKSGDYVAAAGPVTEGVVQARFVVQMGDADVKRMEEFKANLGKTVIAGEVKEIAETKLTLLRPDGQTQVIELDESTSLRRGRDESITLADIKPGDRVSGNGELKNGIFVPKELRVMGAGMGRMRGPGAPPGTPGEPPAPPK